jgi:hypothetical protein
VGNGLRTVVSSVIEIYRHASCALRALNIAISTTLGSVIMSATTIDQLFRIQHLPGELLGLVYSVLSDADLLVARLVSKGLNSHSTTASGTRFFHYLVVILDFTSLANLLEVAGHPTLSNFIIQVSVSGERVDYEVSGIKNEETQSYS